MPDSPQRQGDDPDRWVIPLAAVALLDFLLRAVVPVGSCLLLAGGIRLAVLNEIVLSAGCFLLAGWLGQRWYRRP